MKLETLVRIVSEQKEELLNEDFSAYCFRREANQLSLTSKLAQVVIGVRRCGKSTLCLKYLMEHSVNCGYLSFDDERLDNIKTEDLDMLLEAIYIVYGNNVEYLFFDELQNADAWPLFVNRLLRQKKHVFITGSNSKLLSNELMSHLTGRHNAVALYPFSFLEYCQVRNIDCTGLTTRASAMRKEALHTYLQDGGMPELLYETDKRKYVTSLMNTIIRNDIAKRFKIRNVDSLHKMATYLCDNFGQEFVPVTVGKLFGMSAKTAANYFRYLKEAFLLIGIPKFSFKAQERIRNEKCYVVDVAFPQVHEGGFSLENFGWKLENVVCLELLRRTKRQGGDVFYFKEKTYECDFLVASGGKVEELVQVSYDISSPKTFKREVNGLVKAAEKFNCENLTLITFDNAEQIEIHGHKIRVVGATDWLLANKK